MPLARQRDQRALGEALSARETEPEPEAAAIEAEIERNVHRENAMSGQVLEAQRRVAELILRSKGAWTGDLQRHLADAAARYRSQIVELERARAELVEEVQLGAWLAMSPQTGGQPATYQLPGEPDTVAPGPAVASVMAALRRDSEQLPPPRRPPPTTCAGSTTSSSSSRASTRRATFTRRCRAQPACRRPPRPPEARRPWLTRPERLSF